MEKANIIIQCPLFKDDCLKDMCVWWNKDARNCAINLLVDTLDFQAGTLREILNYIATPEKLRHL